MKPRRVIFRVRYARTAFLWEIVRRGSKIPEYFPTKREAVSMARVRANDVYESGGLAQLVVHNRDGRIAYENTYGRDPERRRG